MNLAIIAAGEGSRLRAEGILTPKALVHVGGIPLVERIIRNAVGQGATAVYCIVNEEMPALRDFLLASDFGAPVDVTVRSTPSSLHSLAALATKLAEKQFLLAAVDSVFKEDEFAGFLEYARRQDKADGTLAVTQFVDDEKPLCVKMDAERRISAFTDDKTTSQWVTGGLYYFAPSILKELPGAINSGVSRLRNFLRLLVNKGYRLNGFPFLKIIDVDHVNDIKTAEEFLTQHPSSASLPY